MNNLTAFNRTLRAIIGAALGFGIVTMSTGVRQVDLGWQLPDGLAILQTHHLPVAPGAAFGLPRLPYVDEYSLYEIILALLFKLGGLGAIHVAFAATFLLVFALPFAGTLRQPRDLVSATLVAVAALDLINRFEQRPEIVGVLLFAVLVRMLLPTPRIERGFLLRLAVLMAVWTNVHSSYLIGLLALGCWLAQRIWWDETAARLRPGASFLAFAVAGGAVLVNPYGWHRIAFTFAQQADLGSNLLSREMWPAWHQPFGMEALLALTGALLALALLSRQRPPGWLAALTLVLFALTLFNIRHMSFLAVGLLYLAAQRRVIEPGRNADIVLAPLLAAGGVALLLFDLVSARSALSDWRAKPGYESRGFAPPLVELARADGYGAVLCHDAEGSYLTFAGGGLRPLIDSGQGRFDDATKRCYFFAVEDPYAFDRALHLLSNVNGVLVTPPVEGWTLAMIRRPGWYLAGCDEHGLLFHRFAQGGDGYGIPTPQQARDLASYRDQALAEHDLVRAFCFSSLIDPTAQSLAILDRSRPSAWSEAFFSFARAWLRSLEPDEVQQFLAAQPQPANRLLRELLLARQPADVALPPAGPSSLERLARVLTLLERQDPAAARALFQRISPPVVSPLYYTLRHRFDPAAAAGGSAAERWQDWNAGGDALFDREFPLLNARASVKATSPDPP